jgi:hypothetical protein
MLKAVALHLIGRLSVCLRKVQACRSLVAYEHSKPNARVESNCRDENLVAHLRSEGITRASAKSLAAKQIVAMRPFVPGAARVVEALLDERANDR